MEPTYLGLNVWSKKALKPGWDRLSRVGGAEKETEKYYIGKTNGGKG